MAKPDGIQYQCWWEQAPPDLRFDTEFEYRCVRDPDEIDDLFQTRARGVVAYDCETKSLDFSIPEPVVGVSFSFTPYDGFYVPLRHTVGVNGPLECLNRVYRNLLKHGVPMFNAPFDLLMLKYEGYDPYPLRLCDTQVLVYNADTNLKMKQISLKESARYFLGRNPETFEDTLGGKLSFDAVDPDAKGAYYACCDTANTMGLYEKLYPWMVRECPGIIALDNALAKRMVHYLNETIYIDCDAMRELRDNLKKRRDEIWREICREYNNGEGLNLASKRSVTAMLERLGIDTGRRTKTGDMGLSEDDLDSIDHPVAKLLVEHAHIEKQRNSYADKLSQQSTGHINYGTCATPTGRFNSGNRKNPFFLQLNYQNLTKPEPAGYRAYYTEESDPKSILGWRFELVDKDMKAFSRIAASDPDGIYVEGFSPNHNVRRAITVPDKNEWAFASIDYAAEELRVAAGLSKEPVWLKAFESGEDVHKRTALELFGEPYDEKKRKKAKIANFGLLYGGSSSVLYRTSGLPQEECDELYSKFWTRLRTLKMWVDREIHMALQNSGYVYTAYGRPRRLGFYLMSPMPRLRSFGERSVVSHQVQGTCGDVMRNVIVDLHDRFFLPRPKDIRFVGMVHDEINFAIRKECLKELLPRIIQAMEVTVPGFTFPLVVDVELGESYGMAWGFRYDAQSDRWVPKAV